MALVRAGVKTGSPGRANLASVLPPKADIATEIIEVREAPRTGQQCTNGVQPTGRRLLSRPYAFRKASRSALIVSACVVGMPCGKPL
jgi:hypothetical protein